MTDAAALPWERPLGAEPLPDGACRFRVWAPAARGVEVDVGGERTALEPRLGGVFEGVARARHGDDYGYALDGGDPLPDPCSRFQPAGVRGPSRVVDPARFPFAAEGWRGLSPDGLLVYELHVGTFTEEGTFAAAARRMAELRALGVTAIELMPVATFPGDRNWGYDGLYTWAPHPAYGGPEGLAALVDAAHADGLGVILDVVYNHVGPGAEALEAFGPYFTDRYGTPWGRAMNFDDADCGGAREWAIQNACMWLRDYRIDGLRVDAVQAIYDMSARHVLAELCERARAAAPWTPVLIAESDLNDPRVVRPAERGGWGFDAQWYDDFHHALHAALSGERDGYYADFGRLADLAGATARPYVYDGRWSAYRRRRHGAPAPDVPPAALVAYSQNHDQVGNRATGDRPAPETLALRALWTLMAPFTPMLFMGEEDGSRQPFQFFTDHIDPEIAEATREGRRREFAAFAGFSAEDVPDPQDPATFARSRPGAGAADPGRRRLHEELIALRARAPEGPAEVRFDEEEGWMVMTRGDLRVWGNFGERPARVPGAGREVLLATHPEARLEEGALSLPPLAGAVTR